MKFSTVLFDIDDTLINFELSFKNAAAKVMALEIGRVANADELQKYYELNNETWFSLNLDEMGDNYIKENYHPLYHKYIYDSCKKAKDELKINAPLEAMIDCFQKELGGSAHINPNAIMVLEALQKDHRICIATNGLTCIQPYKAANFKEYVSHTYISEEIGFMKPDPQFFEYIIKDLGCKKSDCIMIGDSLINDIGGAACSGITACYYNPNHNTNLRGIKPDFIISDLAELLDIV